MHIKTKKNIHILIRLWMFWFCWKRTGLKGVNGINGVKAVKEGSLWFTLILKHQPVSIVINRDRLVFVDLVGDDHAR